MRRIFVSYVILAAAVAACSGLLGIDDVGYGSADASSADAGGETSAGDGSVDANGPACNLAAPFGAPRPLSELNTEEFNENGTLTRDELTLILGRAGASGATLHIARRSNAKQPFDPPIKLPDLNEPGILIRHPTLSPDGKKLIYVRKGEEAGIGAERLAQAERSTPTTAFAPGTSAPFASFPTDRDQTTPYFVTDNEIYLSMSRPATVDFELYSSTYDGVAWSAPKLLVGVNETTKGQFFPVGPADGLSLFFTSNREIGSGAYHIYKTVRASRDAPFDIPSLVQELVLPGATAERPGWLSPDKCRLYFGRNMNERPVVLGDPDAGVVPGTFDLYVASRAPL